MSNHTPTPWFVGKKGRTGQRVFATQQGTDGVVATGIENHANAEFIVRAVNAHDDLLRALQAFVDCQCERDMTALCSRFDKACQIARDAIAKGEAS